MKKIAILVLSILLCTSALFVGCKRAEPIPAAPVITLDVEGTEFTSEFALDYKLPVATCVSNVDGSKLDVVVTAKNPDGEAAVIENGMLKPTGAGKYTVSYNATDVGEFKVPAKEVVITVNFEKAVPGKPVINVNQDEVTAIVTEGDEVVVPTATSTSNADGSALEVAVKVTDANGNEVVVTDGKFVASVVGNYTITYSTKEIAPLNTPADDVTLEVKAVEKLTINFDGEVKDVTTVIAEKYALPVATCVSKVDGSAIDVIVTATDATGKEAIVKDGFLLPTAEGKYVVTYTAKEIAPLNREYTLTLNVTFTEDKGVEFTAKENVDDLLNVLTYEDFKIPALNDVATVKHPFFGWTNADFNVEITAVYKAEGETTGATVDVNEVVKYTKAGVIEIAYKLTTDKDATKTYTYNLTATVTEKFTIEEKDADKEIAYGAHYTVPAYDTFFTVGTEVTSTVKSVTYSENSDGTFVENNDFNVDTNVINAKLKGQYKVTYEFAEVAGGHRIKTAEVVLTVDSYFKDEMFVDGFSGTKGSAQNITYEGEPALNYTSEEGWANEFYITSKAVVDAFNNGTDDTMIVIDCVNVGQTTPYTIAFIKDVAYGGTNTCLKARPAVGQKFQFVLSRKYGKLWDDPSFRIELCEAGSINILGVRVAYANEEKATQMFDSYDQALADAITANPNKDSATVTAENGEIVISNAVGDYVWKLNIDAFPTAKAVFDKYIANPLDKVIAVDVHNATENDLPLWFGMGVNGNDVIGEGTMRKQIVTANSTETIFLNMSMLNHQLLNAGHVINTLWVNMDATSGTLGFSNFRMINFASENAVLKDSKVIDEYTLFNIPTYAEAFPDGVAENVKLGNVEYSETLDGEYSALDINAIHRKLGYYRINYVVNEKIVGTLFVEVKPYVLNLNNFENLGGGYRYVEEGSTDIHFETYDTASWITLTDLNVLNTYNNSDEDGLLVIEGKNVGTNEIYLHLGDQELNNEGGEPADGLDYKLRVSAGKPFTFVLSRGDAIVRNGRLSITNETHNAHFVITDIYVKNLKDFDSTTLVEETQATVDALNADDADVPTNVTLENGLRFQGDASAWTYIDVFSLANKSLEDKGTNALKVVNEDIAHNVIAFDVTCNVGECVIYSYLGKTGKGENPGGHPNLIYWMSHDWNKIYNAGETKTIYITYAMLNQQNSDAETDVDSLAPSIQCADFTVSNFRLVKVTK